MHRNSVDFPEPLAPIRHDDLVVLDHEIDAPKHLELPERLAETLDANGFGHVVAPACRRRRSRSINQSVSRASGIVMSDEQERRDDEARVVEAVRGVDLRRPRRFDDTEHREQRRVLLEARRNRSGAEGSPCGSPEGARRSGATAGGTDRATWPPRSDSGARTRSPLGTPPPRTPNRTGPGPRSRTPPPIASRDRGCRGREGRTRRGRSRATEGSPGTGPCTRSRSGGTGRTRARGAPRITATTRARIRIRTSATRKTSMFSRSACPIPGRPSSGTPKKDSFIASKLKKLSRDALEAGSRDDDDGEHAEEHDRAGRGDRGRHGCRACRARRSCPGRASGGSVMDEPAVDYWITGTAK